MKSLILIFFLSTFWAPAIASLLVLPPWSTDLQGGANIGGITQGYYSTNQFSDGVVLTVGDISASPTSFADEVPLPKAWVINGLSNHYDFDYPALLSGRATNRVYFSIVGRNVDTLTVWIPLMYSWTDDLSFGSRGTSSLSLCDPSGNCGALFSKDFCVDGRVPCPSVDSAQVNLYLDIKPNQTYQLIADSYLVTSGVRAHDGQVAVLSTTFQTLVVPSDIPSNPSYSVVYSPGVFAPVPESNTATLLAFGLIGICFTILGKRSAMSKRFIVGLDATAASAALKSESSAWQIK